MRRYLIFLAVVICAAASCAKEEILNTEVKLVPATIVAESSDFETKTTATWNGNKYNIEWEAGDKLSVFTGVKTETGVDTENHEFTAKETGKLTTFTGELPEAAIGQKIYPIMPYDKDARFDGTTTVYTSVPAEQDGDFYNVVLAGWPRPDTGPGDGEDFLYQFEAVSSIVKFSFDPSRIAGSKNIISISLIADKPICGDAKISFAGKLPVLTPAPNTTGSNVYNVVTIQKNGGFTADDYYFAVFPIDAATGDTMDIVIRFEASDGNIAYTKASLKAVANQQQDGHHIFAANTVKNIGSVKITEYEERPFTSGEFTVAKGKKVTFSRGNLQYRASDNRWRFAPNQWDAQGEKGNTTTTEGGRANQSEWIDMFAYGHTGWTTNKITYMPHAYSGSYGTFYAESNTTAITGTDGDWGHFCSIVNGDKTDISKTWRLLTTDEWNYLLNLKASDPGHKDYQKGRTVNEYGGRYMHFMKMGIDMGVKDEEIIRYGLLIFPDGFVWPSDLTAPNKECFGHKYRSNNEAPKFTMSEFLLLESLGCVFLPASGYVDQNLTLNGFNTEGKYFSSDKIILAESQFTINPQNVSMEAGTRRGLRSVRLVKNVTGF